jgi:nucleoside-diphosphate-sugar epimerase
MRFDLAINSMVLSLFKNAKVSVMRDGSQWRPFIHIKDVSNSYKSVLREETDKTNGQIYNVGSNEQNYQIFPLAKSIGKLLGVNYEIDWYGSQDNRSYQISFDKFRRDLHFQARLTPEDGAKEIYDSLLKGNLIDNLQTNTVSWYRYLLTCHRISTEVTLRESVL